MIPSVLQNFVLKDFDDNNEFTNKGKNKSGIRDVLSSLKLRVIQIRARRHKHKNENFSTSS